MTARIFKPSRNAMQSGEAQTRQWRLEFDPADARFIEPLMGWTGSRDTSGQVRLSFETGEEAIAFAEKHAIPYAVEAPRPHRLRYRTYADNFSYHRLV